MNGIYTLPGLHVAFSGVPSSHPFDWRPEPGDSPPSAMQGSHGVSTLEKGLFCQHECESASGRKEGFM